MRIRNLIMDFISFILYLLFYMFAYYMPFLLRGEVKRESS